MKKRLKSYNSYARSLWTYNNTYRIRKIIRKAHIAKKVLRYKGKSILLKKVQHNGETLLVIDPKVSVLGLTGQGHSFGRSYSILIIDLSAEAIILPLGTHWEKFIFDGLIGEFHREHGLEPKTIILRPSTQITSSSIAVL